MLQPNVARAINKVLEDRLKNIGFKRAEIVEDEDHTGEPILKIVIDYDKVGDGVDPTPTFSLARYVKEAVRPLGETRFPHFQHRFPDDQEFKAA